MRRWQIKTSNLMTKVSIRRGLVFGRIYPHSQILIISFILNSILKRKNASNWILILQLFASFPWKSFCSPQLNFLMETISTLALKNFHRKSFLGTSKGFLKRLLSCSNNATWQKTAASAESFKRRFKISVSFQQH